jgi:hypothetical protein
MSAEELTYLILFGAPTGPKREVIHIAHDRDGELVPRCNSHYVAQQDRGPRRFRKATGRELTFRVCQRCQNWRGWTW